MKRQVTFDQFKNAVLNNPKLQSQLQENPVETIEEFEEHPLLTDKWIYRLITLVLGSVLLVIVIALILLAIWDIKLPDTLIAIGSSALGALTGIMVIPSKK